MLSMNPVPCPTFAPGPWHLAWLCVPLTAATVWATDAAKAGRASPQIKAMVRAALPEYAPKTGGTNATETDPGVVVLLKPMVVTERPLPSDLAWAMLTDKGRAELLKKSYPGATPPFNALTESVPNYATTMRREEQRRQTLIKLADTARLLPVATDAETAANLAKEIKRARYHHPDWKTESMDKSYNNNRR